MPHIGVQPVPQATLRRPYGTTQSETDTLMVAYGYHVGFLTVEIEGRTLSPDDYTADDGISVVFDAPLPAGTNYAFEVLTPFEPADTFTKAEATAKFGQPVLKVEWWGNRSAIPSGYAALDGQLVSRATYPDTTDAILAGTMPVVDEATWWDDPTQRGKYTLGTNGDNIRLPDFNGKSDGAIGAVYLTGDGLKTAGESGLIRPDEMQRIEGSIGNGSSSTGIHSNSSGDTSVDRSGAFTLEYNDVGVTASSGAQRVYTAVFDSANSPDARTNDHTHGVDVSGCWIVRLGGEAVNVGSVDAAQLAADYERLSATLQQDFDFTIIYPNGGSAENPAEVSPDSRYVEDNPFPGYHVHLVTEVYYSGSWGESGQRSSATTADSMGVKSAPFEGGIVVQTAQDFLLPYSRHGLNPFNLNDNISSPLPCRVKVWKLKGKVTEAQE